MVILVVLLLLLLGALFFAFFANRALPQHQYRGQAGFGVSFVIMKGGVLAKPL